MKIIELRNFIISIGFLSLVFYSKNLVAQFAPGNLIVSKVGDGITSLNNSSFSLSLFQYSTSGAIIGAPLAVPTATNGTNYRLTISGSNNTEGALVLSEDGNYLTFAGYDAAPGTANISTAANIKRVIARVDNLMSINTSTILESTTGNAYIGANIRSAVTNNGNQFWTSGNGTSGSGGVRYTTFGNSSGGGTSISVSPTNTRVVSIVGGQLYVSAASGSFVSVSTVGSGLPTTSGQTVTTLPGLPTASGAPMSYVFLDRDPNVLGVDLLYVADLTSGLLKYSWDGSLWTARGSRSGTGVSAVTGFYNCNTGNVDLFMLVGSTPNSIYKLSDASLYNQSITNSGAAITADGTLLATSETNTAFRGLAFSPGTTTKKPSVFNLTGGGTYCSNTSGVEIGLSGSEKGVSYQLYLNNNPTATIVNGNGSTLSFGLRTLSGTYTVIATNLLTNCTTSMSNNVSVTVQNAVTYYLDSDQDGYGKSSSSITACTPPSGYVTNATDCNDGSASIHPGATEVCGNLLDDDCDGLTDEGCAVVLNLKVYLQGLYSGGGLMSSPLFDAGVDINPTHCDSIRIELHSPSLPNTIIYSNTVMLNTNGTASVTYPPAIIGSNYYVVVRHRNSVETWSKLPVAFNSTQVFFDFTIP